MVRVFAHGAMGHRIDPPWHGYHKQKYFHMIFCDCKLQTGISWEISLCCANGTVLLNHCTILFTVGTHTMLLGTCSNSRREM